MRISVHSQKIRWLKPQKGFRRGENKWQAELAKRPKGAKV